MILDELVYIDFHGYFFINPTNIKIIWNNTKHHDKHNASFSAVTAFS